VSIAERFVSRAMAPTIKALFEAVRWSPNRAQLPAQVNDCAVDHSDSVRRILIGKSRYLYDNSPIIHGLVERLVTYIVGNGLTPSPASADSNFNETASASWAGWCKYCDASSRASFATLQRAIVRAMIVDGEIFVNLVRSANNRPRVQLIEAHRVKRINTATLGRPTGYVLPGKDDQHDGPTLAAEFVVHFFRPERAGQTRGIPLLASAINTAQDVHEILAYEKAAVKEQSTRRGVVTTKTGDAPVPVIGRSQRSQSATAGKPDTFYREQLGGETLVLTNGETYEEHVSQRPSASWQGFVDFLSNTVCFPTGLPPSVFLQMKVGGADTRRDLAAAQRVISCWQQDIEAGLQLIFEYVIESDARTQLPTDWRSVSWQYPRAITVDAGRQSQADREDVRTGAMTLAEYCGQYGMSEREHVAQLVAEMLAINPTLTEQQAREAVQRRLYGADSVPAIALPSSDGASAATADVQATALNGAQVAALVEIALKVATGELPRDSAKAIARAAFPLVSEELIDAIFDSIIPKPPAEEQPQEKEKAAA
jgi:capsid protein